VLKFPLLHPQILEALGRAGHGSQVLIADGNYPFSTTLGGNATLVSLNLTPGLINATQALQAIVSAVPIEAAAVMDYSRQGPYAQPADPPIWEEFRTILSGAGLRQPLELIERFQFYKTGGEDRVALVIATAEQRIYANILLTLGVVMPR
jgi:L-fucose mutarotase